MNDENEVNKLIIRQMKEKEELEEARDASDIKMRIGGIIIAAIGIITYKRGKAKWQARKEDKQNKLSELMIACEAGLTERARELIEAGADVNEQNPNGVNALIVASGMGNQELVELLLKHKADPNRGDALKVTPLMYAAQLGESESGDACLQALLAAGANPLDRNQSGWTLIHFTLSCDKTNHEHLRQFIELGVDVNATDSGMIEGNYLTTALCYAALYNDRESAQILIDAGATLGAASSTSPSPLAIACWHGKDEMIEMLLKAGSDIESANKQGSTPLIIAAGEGYTYIVKNLLAHGANAKHRNKKGHDALHYARANKHQAVALLLAEAQQ